MHSFEATEIGYPLPLSLIIFTVFPLTTPGKATMAVTVSTKWKHTATNLPLPYWMSMAMFLLDQTMPNDSDYKPSRPRKRYTPARRSGLEEAMDELNRFLMYIHEITPEMASERKQKENEQEERAAQEASRSKVMEWRNQT